MDRSPDNHPSPKEVVSAKIGDSHAQLIAEHHESELASSYCGAGIPDEEWR
jgi:hypothetical protein